jgi:N-acetylglucosaminyldiphosphoundecaprenol N-acetyl-beta-D-mannosaminyltransferase
MNSTQAPVGRLATIAEPTADRVGATWPVYAKVSLMGLQLHNVTEPEVVHRIVTSASRGQGGWMATPNVDILRQTTRDPALRRLVGQADLVVADGMPLVWASRLQGDPLKARVPGSEAINGLCREAARAGIGVLLLGGSPGTARRAAEVLAGRYPGLIVGHSCPDFPSGRDQEALAEVSATLMRTEPGIVFCAFGFPKQEHIMVALHEAFPAAWFVACGGTFSMVAGDAPKAPVWMRKASLEWLHRLRLEPRRLFARYVLHDLPFALRLLANSALSRAGARRRWRP